MMKKILLALVLTAPLLGGCATFQKDISVAYGIVTGISVSPTTIIVAANSFDALEATATTYLIACKSHPALTACAVSTRYSVIAAVRSGRTARNGLEPYIASGTAGPTALYNTLVAAISSLQASAISGVSK
jgi:predicted small secreted protein